METALQIKRVLKMSKYGYIDKSGSFVIPPQFDDCYEYSEGIASVEIDGKSGFIDKQGDFVIPPPI